MSSWPALLRSRPVLGLCDPALHNSLILIFEQNDLEMKSDKPSASLITSERSWKRFELAIS